MAPDVPANCSCGRPGSCSANNCYNNYWCDTSTNHCVAPPTNCGTSTSTSGSTTTSSTSSTGSSSGGGTPLPTCANRPSDVTQIDALVQVYDYLGVRTGSNGPHEDFDGTITTIFQVADMSKVDSMNVQVAMNMVSSTDPNGLPNEIPLSVGQSIEVVGEYIPSSTATCSSPNGPCAVIHFTHSPCGWVVINGTTYQ